MVLSKIEWKTKYTKLIKTVHMYSDYLKLYKVTNLISELISRRNFDEYQNYIASKLNDPKTNGKTYWSI